MLECYTKKTPIAKKKHTCSLCGETINVGENYITYNGKTSDGWFYDKYHLVCQKIIDCFLDDTGEDEYDAESINEWLCDLKCHDCNNYNMVCDGIGFPLDCPKVREYFK